VPPAVYESERRRQDPKGGAEGPRTRGPWCHLSATRSRRVPDYALTLRCKGRCGYVVDGRTCAANPKSSRACLLRTALERRAACAARLQGQRAGICRAVLAPPPSALPLLPLDRARRGRRPGRAAERDDARACVSALRRARSCREAVVVPDRPQRGGERPAQAPS